MDKSNYYFEQTGESEMPQKDIPKIIQDLKSAKKEKEITYPRLLDMLEATTKSVRSLSSTRS